MDKYEIEGDLCDTYRSFVNHLLKKYGPAPCNYFTGEDCKKVDPRISRANEGLQCHHIDEDKAIMLSDPEYAIKNPFKYQEANRLVYCNLLEHLILHVLITREPRKKSANPGELVGLGGAINYLIPQINDYYSGHQFKQEYKRKQNEILKDSFDGYIYILTDLLAEVIEQPYLRRYITKRKLSLCSDKTINRAVYERLATFE